jgi:hypothetical protein
VSDHYNSLTEAEAAHWDEYTRLRELSDWEGFDAAQDERRADARRVGLGHQQPVRALRPAWRRRVERRHVPPVVPVADVGRDAV